VKVGILPAFTQKPEQTPSAKTKFLRVRKPYRQVSSPSKPDTQSSQRDGGVLCLHLFTPNYENSISTLCSFSLVLAGSSLGNTQYINTDRSHSCLNQSDCPRSRSRQVNHTPTAVRASVINSHNNRLTVA
jgi:hypothetical protein